MKKYLLVSILSLLFIGVSCNKYPDGPFFSIYSAESRITGDWVLKYLYENGHDISQPFKNSSCYSKLYFTYDKKAGANSGRFGCTSKILGNDTCSASGSWYINNSKKNLTMTAMGMTSDFPALGPIFQSSTISNEVYIKWRITRLTFKDFWLTVNFNNKEYELILGK